jgi:hypothetical protein
MTAHEVTNGLLNTFDAAIYILGFLVPFVVFHYWREFKKYRQWQLRTKRFWEFLYNDD